MSGIIGIWSETRDVAADLYFGLVALQHRGQESCGIAVTKDLEVSFHKDMGLANDVFDLFKLSELKGSMGIGHVRYSVQGESGRENTQPLVLKYFKGGLCIALNGTIVNADALREEFSKAGAIYQTTSDTEVLAYAIAQARTETGSVEDALNQAMKNLWGAYALVITSPRKIIAAKDPWGFRPLAMGRKGNDIIFASETSALDCLGAEFERELDPGEIVVVKDGKAVSIRDNCGSKKTNFCIFEYIYFARPDSVIHGRLVNDARRMSGRLLAKDSPVDADIIISVPESGIPAAVGFAQESGIPLEEGLFKNRYITRTFITPEQTSREAAVLLKLNPIKEYVRGKRVCMVDDSLVRGTTMQVIAKALRDAGAAEVHARISSPSFLWPCYFGTDVKNRDQLLAANYTDKETARLIGADSLAYLRVERLKEIMPERTELGFCQACFTGEYPIDVHSLSGGAK